MHYIRKIILMTDSELITHEEDRDDDLVPVPGGEGDTDGI